jgi:hypothetical protein
MKKRAPCGAFLHFSRQHICPHVQLLYMKLLRSLVLPIIFIAVFAPLGASAATPAPSQAVLLAELQVLMLQVQLLEAKVAALQAGSTVSVPATQAASVAAAPVSGKSTLVVAPVPLLSGGVAHAGDTVPVSYLQITNVGSATTTLTGFTVVQKGSAPTSAIIGFTTVDDKGGSRGTTGGTEGLTVFTDGTAIAAVNATFAPGQMKLFTVKAVLSKNVSAAIGKTLMLSISGLETPAAAKGSFPISGTTWTISN